MDSSGSPLTIHSLQVYLQRFKQDVQQRNFQRGSLPLNLIITVAAIVLVRFVYLRLHRAYGSSLRSIPGPFLAKFTDVQLRYHDVVGDRFYWLRDLHKKYGPYVRISPDDVAVADPGAVKKIHGLGTEFRKRQQPGTAFNIFSMSEPRSHRHRQRFYVNAFSNDKIKASHAPSVRELCRMFIQGVRKDAAESPNHSADMYKWCMLFGYDVAVEVVFGNAPKNGLMGQGKDVEEVMMGMYLQKQNAWMQFSFPTFLVARWLTPIFPKLGETFKVEGKYKDLWETTPRQKEIASRTTFVQGAQYDEKSGVYALEGGHKMSQYDIARDVTTFLGAGGEPIGATLVYLIYTVLQDPKLQAELEAEARTLSEPITDAEVEQKCPLLEGAIYEALRLFGGGLTILPRYAQTAQTVGPYTIPPGTCVVSHNHQLHRNPAVWEDPEKFDPRRWMKPGQSKALQTDTFQPFSSGARGCIAIHLVMTELRLFVGTFFRELPGLKLGPSVSEKSMRISDRFHFAPASKSLEVVLPRK